VEGAEKTGIAEDGRGAMGPCMLMDGRGGAVVSGAGVVGVVGTVVNTNFRRGRCRRAGGWLRRWRAGRRPLGAVAEADGVIRSPRGAGACTVGVSVARYFERVGLPTPGRREDVVSAPRGWLAVAGSWRPGARRRLVFAMESARAVERAALWAGRVRGLL